MTLYHQPVLLNECIQYLKVSPGKIYIDATLGGGGHSKQIFESADVQHVYAFDQDAEARQEAEKNLKAYQDKLTIIPANFEHLRTELALRKVKGIDGILFDLGVSSHQIDKPERGFSFEKEALLDMRMDTSAGSPARDVLNELSIEELSRIFREYGEEQAAYKIAGWITQSRMDKPINTVNELNAIIEKGMKANPVYVLKTKVRIYQALRIYVNRELDVLKTALSDALHLLNPGGRIVVLSYHSLEDRIVKGIFKDFGTGCNCPTHVLKCVCNRTQRIDILTPKPLTASDEELKVNSRSRSAKLRAAEKIDRSLPAGKYRVKREKNNYGMPDKAERN